MTTPTTIERGDFFVTRNLTEAENASPGYWNHVAVYAGDGIVVEAQTAPDMVIGADLEEFWNRYPHIRVLRGLGTPEQQRVLADKALEMRGTPYRRVGSLHWFFSRRKSRGENCVSTARRAFKLAMGYDPRWRKPDDVVSDERLVLVASKGAG